MWCFSLKIIVAWESQTGPYLLMNKHIYCGTFFFFFTIQKNILIYEALKELLPYECSDPFSSVLQSTGSRLKGHSVNRAHGVHNRET